MSQNDFQVLLKDLIFAQNIKSECIIEILRTYKLKM